MLHTDFSMQKIADYYIIAFVHLLQFFSHKAFFASITCDDFSIEGLYYMISFANTRQFGHNAFIAPLAKPDDGLMDIVAVKPFPKNYVSHGFAIKMFTGSIRKI